MNVRALQVRLKTLGYEPGPADGIMGRRTLAAIKAFQTASGLIPDGVMGPKTLAALQVVPNARPSAPPMVSSRCVDLVKAWEGIEDGNPATVELEPYVCPAGVVTVGWGHVLTDPAGRQIKPATHGGTRAALAAGGEALRRLFGKPAITRDEAKGLLAMDLNAFAEAVGESLHAGGGSADQAAFDAMVSLAFNIGAAGFARSSVRRLHLSGAVVSRSLDLAALQRASRSGANPSDLASAYGAWSRGGGVWLLGLFRRRVCEAMVHRGDALDGAITAAQRIARL